MNWNSQFVREIKAVLVWGLIPFTGLMSIIKVVWDWYISGAINVGNIFQLLVSLLVVVVCGYLARKEYRRWQANALAGTTGIGPVARVVSTSSSDGNVLRSIVVVGLIAVLAVFRPIAIAPILILWCTAVVWWSFLSTFMASSQCIIGTQGLWTAFAGWKVSVPYSAIERVNLRTAVDSAQVWITLSAKEAFQGRVDLPMPLDQEVVDILEDHIRVASPTSLKT